jgi:hypothetical protein
MSLRSTLNPGVYHGLNKKPPFFEGWYYKLVSADERDKVAIIPGVILGAVVLIGLPEVLREVQQYRMLAFGALLVAMMIFRPEGLIPSARRKMEFKE